jgi:Rrf2 family protein
MRITLGRKGDYSVRAVLDVARHTHDGRRKTREIAEAMDIPRNYLTQILADLVTRGLLDARAGPAGGYALARHPDQITLLDVVAASEGPVTLDQCVLEGGPCDWVGTCPVHDTWARAQTAFTEQLAATTFADLAEIDAQIQAGTHHADAPPHRERTIRRGGQG